MMTQRLNFPRICKGLLSIRKFSILMLKKFQVKLTNIIHICSLFDRCSWSKRSFAQRKLIMGKMLLIMLSLLFSLILQSGSTSGSGIRAELSHVDSNEDFTVMELLTRAVDRANQRIAIAASTLASSPTSTDVQVPTYAGNGEFLLELAIGTPPLSFSAIMDTGSDLIWTQCQPCNQCLSQPTPLYSPSKSHTFAALPCTSDRCQALPNTTCSPNCSYVYPYADKSYTEGILGTETFTFGGNATAPAAVSDIAFGCGTTNGGSFDNSSGIVGMARGPLSLVSQLGDGRFSYCLTSYGDRKKSPLLIGSLANLSGRTQSTPFVSSPDSPPFSSFYYLSLQGITVGTTMLPIPNTTFAMKANGTGGVIIDSGTTVTSLTEPAYTALKRAFMSQIKLPVANGSALELDICFSFTAAEAKVPSLIFHFDGADMELPPENYIMADSSVGLLCVVIFKSNFSLSIFGNYQQQNMHILYDLAGRTLSFEPASCDKL